MRTRNPIKWLPAITAMTLALSACDQDTPERYSEAIDDASDKAKETVEETKYKLQECAEDGISDC